MHYLKNPFDMNPLGERRTPQQEALFTRFFGDTKRHAVIHGPGCGTSIAAIAIGVANILDRGRETILVVPTQYHALKSINEEYSQRVVCHGHKVVAKDTGVSLQVIPYTGLTREFTTGIEWGSVDLIIDGTWAYVNDEQQLFDAIDALQPERLMTFDSACHKQYGSGRNHPAISVIERYKCEVVNLSSLESPLIAPDGLQALKRHAVRRGYDVEKYLAGEMF